MNNDPTHLNKAEIRLEMRHIYENVMILDSMTKIALALARNVSLEGGFTSADKAEAVKITLDALTEVRELRQQYEALKRIHDEL